MKHAPHSLGDLPKKVLLTCEFCLKQFEHGFPCHCNREQELERRKVVALEDIAYQLQNVWNAIAQK